MNKGNEIKKHGLKKYKNMKKKIHGGLIFFKQRKRDKLRD